MFSKYVALIMPHLIFKYENKENLVDLQIEFGIRKPKGKVEHNRKLDKASKLLLPIRYDFVQVVGSLIQKLCKIFPTCYTYKGMLKPTTLNFRFISNLHHLSDTTCLTDTNENGLSIASLLFSFSKLLKPVNYFPSFCIS